MSGYILLIIGSATIITFLAGKSISRFNLPMVTGYVIIGMILGRSFFNVITPEMVNKMGILNDLALGIVAFLIGGELNLQNIRRLGKNIGVIALCESMGACALVILTTYLFTKEVYTSLILGAVAAATAPAATVNVISQYRAQGPLTNTILGVVGSDDAIGLILYSFASSIALNLIRHAHISFISMVLTPFGEVIFSILLGALIGLIIGVSLKKLRTHVEIFTLGIGSVLIAEGLANHWHLNELLSVMALAAVAVNVAPTRKFSNLMDTIDIVGTPVIAVFFCLFSTKLDIGLLPQIGLLGLAYAFARMAGKVSGASLGATISHAPTVVRKYVGLSFFPQIGVALALAAITEKKFSPLGEAGSHLATLVTNILLFTTIITEVVGPILTAKSLSKAGETGKKS